MPTYDYYCENCNESWEENKLISERDEPLKTPCVKCGEKIKRGVAAARVSYEGAHSMMKRAGNEWNDVLKGIKKASDKENTINTY